MDMNYRQCHLTKGVFSRTYWLPSKFAKKGKYLQLKMASQWDDGWRVQEVYSIGLPHKVVMTLNEAYRNQREVSDI